MCGIYCIENIINHKRYIGQSIDIDSRWKCHLSRLNRHCHNNYHLQCAWDKYGEQAFNFYVLKLCNAEDLDNYEILYISNYNTTDPNYGYNLESGGNANKIISEETRQKQSLSHKGKKLQLTAEQTQKRRDLMIERWKDEEYLERMRRCSQERWNDEEYRAKILSSLNDRWKDESYRKHMIEIRQVQNLSIETRKKLSEAGKKGGRLSKGKQGHHLSEDEKKHLSEITKRAWDNGTGLALKVKKSVLQIDKSNGQIINKYDSITEASKYTGICSSTIGKACRKNSANKTAGGYIWKYADNDDVA